MFVERNAANPDDPKAAEKFKITPVSVMNFVEGTRLTPQKQEKLRSPYKHLLKPKAGGLTFILTAMGTHLSSILDVTIAYPGGTPTLWGFLGGDVKEIKIRVRSLPVEEALLGDYPKDKAFRREFTKWLAGIWAEKDELMASLLEEPQNSGMS